MKISKIRKLLGDSAKDMTDDEVLKIEDTMRTLANIMIDKILSMSPEERATLEMKIRNEKKLGGNKTK